MERKKLYEKEYFVLYFADRKKTQILIFMCFLQDLFCKGGRCAEKSNSGDPMKFSKGGVLSC